MIVLAMNTAYKHLVLGVYKDGVLLGGSAEECFKHQSENLFVALKELLHSLQLDYKDLDAFVITDGPGSYTGIRIAMAAAKVLASQMKKKLGTVSTMQLYAGREGSWNVILDARGGRVYAAHIENGEIPEGEQIIELDHLEDWLNAHPGELIGDTYLLGQESSVPDFLKNFGSLLEQVNWVDNVHALCPRYLKESDAYKV